MGIRPFLYSISLCFFKKMEFGRCESTLYLYLCNDHQMAHQHQTHKNFNKFTIPEYKHQRTIVKSKYMQMFTLSRSGCVSATWSLHTMQLPRADSLSSIRWTTTESGRLFRKCWSSNRTEISISGLEIQVTNIK